MTALLWFLVFEIPITAAVVLLVIHQMLLSHQTIIAAVIGKRATDLTFELKQAEERVTEAAKYGVRVRSGPARLKD